MVSDEGEPDGVYLVMFSDSICGNVDLWGWSAGPVAHVTSFTLVTVWVRNSIHPEFYSSLLTWNLYLGLCQNESSSTSTFEVLPFYRVSGTSVSTRYLLSSKYKARDYHPMRPCHAVVLDISRTEHLKFFYPSVLSRRGEWRRNPRHLGISSR